MSRLSSSKGSSCLCAILCMIQLLIRDLPRAQIDFDSHDEIVIMGWDHGRDLQEPYIAGVDSKCSTVAQGNFLSVFIADIQTSKNSFLSTS